MLLLDLYGLPPGLKAFVKSLYVSVVAFAAGGDQIKSYFDF